MTDADTRPRKECPFCAELILLAAKKCKHCGEFLDGDRSDRTPPTPAVSSSSKVKCGRCSCLILPTTATKYNGLCAPCSQGKRKPKLVEPPTVDQRGILNTRMSCPHCQRKGSVRTRPVKQKAGISGGKATAAIITGGISVLAVGLSRKEERTQASCSECGNTWFF